jgi:hypothetical protein
MKTRFWCWFFSSAGLVVLFMLSSRMEVSSSYSAQSGCPDLAPQIKLSNSNPQPGEAINISITAVNRGSIDASAFYIHLYLDPIDRPPTATTPSTSFHRVPSLAVGTDYTWTRTGQMINGEGEHVVYAWIDRNNQIPSECDKTNNVGMYTFFVGDQGCAPDQFDVTGDELCQNAVLVTVNADAQRRTFCPAGDQDWIAFDAQAGVEYAVVADQVDDDAEVLMESHYACPGTQRSQSAVAAGIGGTIHWPIFSSSRVFVKAANGVTGIGGRTGYNLSVTALCSADAYEPDDGCAQAQELPAGVLSQPRSFCRAGDQDWMRIWVDAGNRYRLETQQSEANAQPSLALYTRCNDASVQMGSPNGVLEWTAQTTGELLVKVQNHAAVGTGLQTGYRLLLTSRPAQDDAFEPDDSREAASPLQAAITPQVRRITVPGDQDWYYLDAVAGQRYRIATFELGAADTVLCLYDVNGAEAVCDDDSGEGFGSQVFWQAEETARYYVRVYDSDPSRGGSESIYKIVLRVDAQVCDDDLFEPDNHDAFAKDLPIDGVAQRRNFCPGGDEDWLRFWVQSPGVYDIRVDAVGPDSDPMVDLVDLDGQNVLWSNDDHGPGTSARILWRFARAGVYYLRVASFDGQNAGRGTEYDVRVALSYEQPTPTLSPTPSPTPSPTLTPSPTPTPGWPVALPTPNGAPTTLVVTNRQRMILLYGEQQANLVVNRLAALIASEGAPGILLNLDSDPTIMLAYAEWQSDLASIDRANRVANLIRSALWTQIAQHPTVEYIVLVGDDRVIPFYRERDNVRGLNDLREASYSEIGANSSVGTAIKANVSLTDDFYAAREIRNLAGKNLYLPDKALGRLVETPAQIVSSIDRFLATGDPTRNYELATGTALVVGGSAVQHGAVNKLCERLRPSLSEGLNCELNNNTWGWAAFQSRLLNPIVDYRVHVLHTGGNHWEIRAGNGERIAAATVRDVGVQLNRGIAATTMSHGALNTPPDEARPHDLPEIYLEFAEIFVGSTGYTFHARDPAEAYSGKLMNLFLWQLHQWPLVEQSPTAGKAWVRAKHLYAQQIRNASEYDRKILHIATFYGLPMYRLPRGFNDSNPYPSVRVDSNMVHTAAADETITATLRLSLEQGIASLQYRSTQEGAYFVLDGAVNWNPGSPAQPVYAEDLRNPMGLATTSARSVLWIGGVYTDVEQFTPLIPQTIVDDNDTVVAVAEAAKVPEGGDVQPSLVWLDPSGQQIVVDWGQFDAARNTQRLYSGLSFELIYSSSSDQIPANVTVASGQAATALPTVKIEADDASGVRRVVVLYTDLSGLFQTIDLEYRPDMHKWIGRLPVLQRSLWTAQVIDGAGNVTLVTRKGDHFQAAQGVESAAIYWLHLPMIVQ